MDFTFYILIAIVIIASFDIFFIVKQQSSAVIERFGKFTSIRSSGLQLKLPLIDRIAEDLLKPTNRCSVETKTKDDVFVKIKVSFNPGGPRTRVRRLL